MKNEIKKKKKRNELILKLTKWKNPEEWLIIVKSKFSLMIFIFSQEFSQETTKKISVRRIRNQKINQTIKNKKKKKIILFKVSLIFEQRETYSKAFFFFLYQKRFPKQSQSN